MVRHRHKVCYCSLLLLSLLLVPRLVSASLPHNSYLHLVNRHRRLHGSADGQPASPCAGGCRHTAAACNSTQTPRHGDVVSHCMAPHCLYPAIELRAHASVVFQYKIARQRCKPQHSFFSAPVFAGKQAGDPIEGQYIVVFDTKKVPTVEDGITA
jgi:hypothetical protein